MTFPTTVLTAYKDLHILDEPAKPFETLEWTNGRPLDLAEYMKEHVYMYSSGSAQAKLRISRSRISNVIDLFGKEVTFFDKDETEA